MKYYAIVLVVYYFVISSDIMPRLRPSIKEGYSHIERLRKHDCTIIERSPVSQFTRYLRLACIQYS